MFEKIEKEYKKRINLKGLKIAAMVVGVLLGLIAVISKGKIVLQIVLSLLVYILFASACYVIYVTKNEKLKVFDIKKNIKSAIERKQEKNANIFEEILNEFNIKTEKQIREYLEYVKLKLPQKNKINIGSLAWEIGITILNLIIACIVFEENGTLNTLMTGTLFGWVAVGVICLLFIIAVLIMLKGVYIDLFNKYDVYENFVDMLTWRLIHMEEEDD